MSDKAVITCALNGVLTDPKQHNVPVTPEQMAREAKAAFNAGASIMHIHLRQQEPNKGHLPSWDVSVSREIQQAMREACPGVIINHTTGTSGPNYQGALDCVRETRPEIAACNAGSLNYLKVKSDNTWAWPPMMFDNAVEKVQDYLDVMKVAGTIPEFECFDVGIVRCVGMYRQTGMYSGPLEYNFVMGVASGMPADPELLPILLKLKLPEAHWQVTAIGRAEIWPLHQRCADLGGHLRTGLEDTFYLADGTKVTSNGQLIEAIAACARRAGPRDREPRRSAADFWDQALAQSIVIASAANAIRNRCRTRKYGFGLRRFARPGMTEQDRSMAIIEIDHRPRQRRLQGQPRRHAGADRADARAGRAHARGVGRRQGPLPQARAVAAARARGAGARSRLALHRAVDAGRLHVRCAGCRQERARRRRDRRHRLRLRHPLHGQRQ